jgi:hypothetical protein
MRNEDFTVKDLDSTSEWLRTAPSENYQYGVAMQEMQEKLRCVASLCVSTFVQTAPAAALKAT